MRDNVIAPFLQLSVVIVPQPVRGMTVILYTSRNTQLRITLAYIFGFQNFTSRFVHFIRIYLKQGGVVLC